MKNLKELAAVAAETAAIVLIAGLMLGVAGFCCGFGIGIGQGLWCI